MSSQREIDEAYDNGVSDREKSDEMCSTNGGVLQWGIFGGYYNPPSDPELKEAYDDGFNGN